MATKQKTTKTTQIEQPQPPKEVVNLESEMIKLAAEKGWQFRNHPLPSKRSWVNKNSGESVASFEEVKARISP